MPLVAVSSPPGTFVAARCLVLCWPDRGFRAPAAPQRFRLQLERARSYADAHGLQLVLYTPRLERAGWDFIEAISPPGRRISVIVDLLDLHVATGFKTRSEALRERISRLRSDTWGACASFGKLVASAALELLLDASIVRAAAPRYAVFPRGLAPEQMQLHLYLGGAATVTAGASLFAAVSAVSGFRAIRAAKGELRVEKRREARPATAVRRRAAAG